MTDKVEYPEGTTHICFTGDSCQPVKRERDGWSLPGADGWIFCGWEVRGKKVCIKTGVVYDPLNVVAYVASEVHGSPTQWVEGGLLMNRGDQFLIERDLLDWAPGYRTRTLDEIDAAICGADPVASSVVSNDDVAALVREVRSLRVKADAEQADPLKAIADQVAGAANYIGATYTVRMNDGSPMREITISVTKAGGKSPNEVIEELKDKLSGNWQPMSTAPKDGTLVRLLVDFDAHPTDDNESDPHYPTIGANNFENDELDEWLFAGWCWTYDRWTQGEGTPVGWMPMLAPIVAPATTDPEPVRWERMSKMQGGKWFPCSDKSEADHAVACGWSVRGLYDHAPKAGNVDRDDKADRERDTLRALLAELLKGEYEAYGTVFYPCRETGVDMEEWVERANKLLEQDQ